MVGAGANDRPDAGAPQPRAAMATRDVHARAAVAAGNSWRAASRGSGHVAGTRGSGQGSQRKKLGLASHILGYGGLVVSSGGSIIAGIVIGGVAAGISAIIGLAMAVIGAIIGQVGRGMQGRAI